MSDVRTGSAIAIPAGSNADGDGIVVGTGKVPVDAYIDFLCPFCRQFERLAGPTLTQLVAVEAISLVYHPMNFLDRLSTTRYSTRAAAASGCASDAGRFVDYTHLLFVNQPPEGGPGLSDDQLIALGVAAGINDPKFRLGVLNGSYLEWPPFVTERAMARGVSGTPSVFVGGRPIPANVKTILAAVEAVSRLP
jgi:protein-disulfide isomerase